MDPYIVWHVRQRDKSIPPNPELFALRNRLVGKTDAFLVCTENLNPDVVMMKSAEDGV